MSNNPPGVDPQILGEDDLRQRLESELKTYAARVSECWQAWDMAGYTFWKEKADAIRELITGNLHFPLGTVRIIPVATYDDLPEDARLGDWGAVYHDLQDDTYHICTGCGIEAGYSSVLNPEWLPKWFEPTDD